MLFWKHDMRSEKDIVCPDNSSFPMNTILSTTALTAIHMGNTLTYPTPYAFFSTYLVPDCGDPVYNVAIPLDATEIKTLGIDNAPFDARWYRTMLTPEHWSIKTVMVNGTTRTYPLVPYSAYNAEKRQFFYTNADIIYNDYIEKIIFQLDTGHLRSLGKEQFQYCNATFLTDWIDPPIFLTPVRSGVAEVTFPEQMTPPSISAVTGSRDIEPFTPVPRPGSLGDLSPFAPITQSETHLPTPRPSLPSDTLEGSSSGITIQAKPTTIIVPASQNPIFNDGRGVLFSHGMQDLYQRGRSTSFDPIASQWVYTETNAVFTVKGVGFVTASQIGSGTFAIQGTTLSKGGSAISFHGSIITAAESGVVLIDATQHTRAGGQSRLSTKGAGDENSSDGEQIENSGTNLSDGTSVQFSTVSNSHKKGGGAALYVNSPFLILAFSVSLISQI